MSSVARLRPRCADVSAGWGRHMDAGKNVCDGRVSGPHERAIVLGSQKLIVGPGGETELYDLASDPGEHRAAAPPAATRATLDRTLAQFGTRMAHKGSAGASVPLDEESRARLKALGYVR